MSATTAPDPSIDWNAVAGRPPVALDTAAVRRRLGEQRVLVTGAAGSLGRALCRAIAAAQPAALILCDQHESSLFHLRQALAAEFPGVALRAALVDVRAAPRIRRTFVAESPGIVFHLAAYKHVPWGEEDPEAFADANVFGTRAIAEAAGAAGTARIVFPSTDKAVDPPSLYGATKRIAEGIFQAAAGRGGAACTLARFVNVLGSQGSAPETFLRQIRQGLPLTVTDEAMRRYWITPEHATLLLLHAACLDGQIVYVAPDAGKEIPVVEIARRVYRQVHPGGGTPDVRVTGLRPGERLSEPIIAPHERLEPAPLPGIQLIRGGRPVDAASLRWSLAHLEALLLDGAPPLAIRAATFAAARQLESQAGNTQQS